MEDFTDYLEPNDLEMFLEIFNKLIMDGVEIEKIEKAVHSDDFFEKTINFVNITQSENLYQYICQNYKEKLEINRKENKDFEYRLLRNWKRPFDLYETMIYISQEIGDEFNEEFRSKAVEKNDLVFEALIHLHGRACQVSLEILKQMQSGFPDGAIARWRTLHEINVVSMFIKKGGWEAANKYLLHEGIESYNSIEKYIRKPEILKKHQSILKLSLLPRQEMKQIVKLKDKLCEKFPKGYDKDYGWAIGEIENPNFSNIEESVEMDHLRPYYKMANISVHGGSKGIRFHHTSPNRNLIPAGPGNMGMSQPGQLAAISLLQINTTLLMTRPGIQRISTILALKKLLGTIKKSFMQVHRRTKWRYRQKVRIMMRKSTGNHRHKKNV